MAQVLTHDGVPCLLLEQVEYENIAQRRVAQDGPGQGQGQGSGSGSGFRVRVFGFGFGFGLALPRPLPLPLPLPLTPNPYPYPYPNLRSPFLRHSWIIAVASSSEDSAVLSTWEAVSISKY